MRCMLRCSGDLFFNLWKFNWCVFFLYIFLISDVIRCCCCFLLLFIFILIRIQGAFLQQKWSLCAGFYGWSLSSSECVFSAQPGKFSLLMNWFDSLYVYGNYSLGTCPFLVILFLGKTIFLQVLFTLISRSTKIHLYIHLYCRTSF